MLIDEVQSPTRDTFPAVISKYSPILEWVMMGAPAVRPLVPRRNRSQIWSQTIRRVELTWRPPLEIRTDRSRVRCSEGLLRRQRDGGVPVFLAG